MPALYNKAIKAFDVLVCLALFMETQRGMFAVKRIRRVTWAHVSAAHDNVSWMSWMEHGRLGQGQKPQPLTVWWLRRTLDGHKKKKKSSQVAWEAQRCQPVSSVDEWRAIKDMIKLSQRGCKMLKGGTTRGEKERRLWQVFSAVIRAWLSPWRGVKMWIQMCDSRLLCYFPVQPKEGENKLKLSSFLTSFLLPVPFSSLSKH